MLNRTAIFMIGASLILAAPVAAQSENEDGFCNTTVFGTWDTGDGGEVVIDDCGDGTPCGRITKLPDPDLQDENNKDETLRERPLMNLQIFSGFEKDDKGWRRGKIYDPKKGATYKSKLRFETNNILEVKGCIGAFCEKEKWNRIGDESCPNES